MQLRIPARFVRVSEEKVEVEAADAGEGGEVEDGATILATVRRM